MVLPFPVMLHTYSPGNSLMNTFFLIRIPDKDSSNALIGEIVQLIKEKSPVYMTRAKI